MPARTRPDATLGIGAVSERTGVAPSALRYYERERLIGSVRSESGHRRYARDVLRRVSFIRIAQSVGLSLDEVRATLATLPDGRTPTEQDWERVAASWGPRLDAQIALLQRMRERLCSCIGCGCLSLATCRLANPDDTLRARGSGPRLVVDAD